MSHIPSELKYATSHEWIRVEANGEAVVGITEHAQDLLGDMVFVDLPEVGKQIGAGDDCAVAESVKAASDIYSPVSGEIVAINEELEGSPELVNSDPYGAGWADGGRDSLLNQIVQALGAHGGEQGPFVCLPAGPVPAGIRVKSRPPLAGMACHRATLFVRQVMRNKVTPCRCCRSIRYRTVHTACGIQNMSGVGISRLSGTSGLGYQDLLPGIGK